MPERLDFKVIARSIDIADVADFTNLKPSKGNRYSCPACDSERSIELFADTNSFACYAMPEVNGKKYGGDCIGLLAHVRNYSGMYKAAAELQEHFLSRASARTAPVTPPTEPERRTAKAQPPPAPFDPDKFAAKLVYSDEVAELGFSEEDAHMLGVGLHPQRKTVYLPLRHADGSVAGFVGVTGSLKMPPRWLPTTIVPFRKKQA